jgi:hypothetical protein
MLKLLTKTSRMNKHTKGCIHRVALSYEQLMNNLPSWRVLFIDLIDFERDGQLIIVDY